MDAFDHGADPNEILPYRGNWALGFCWQESSASFLGCSFPVRAHRAKRKKCHFFGVVVGSFILFYLSVPTLASKLLQSRNLVI